MTTPPPLDPVKFGEVIRWLRQHGPNGPMSQAELGRLAGGVMRQAVTNWEKGRRMPDLPTTALIAAALGVAAWRLIRAGQIAAGGVTAAAAVAAALAPADAAARPQLEAADEAARTDGEHVKGPKSGRPGP